MNDKTKREFGLALVAGAAILVFAVLALMHVI